MFVCLFSLTVEREKQRKREKTRERERERRETRFLGDFAPEFGGVF